MKKLLVVFVVLCVCLTSAIASETDTYEHYNNYFKLSEIINGGVKKNQMIISRLSGNLSNTERAVFFEGNKKDPVFPFWINLSLGCGIGSYIQGDTVGGTTALCGQLGSLATMGAGIMMATSTPDYTGEPGYENNSPSSAGYLLTTIGGLGFLAFRIYDCIRPFKYAATYNKALQNALNPRTSLAIVPTGNKKCGTGMAMVASVTY